MRMRCVVCVCLLAACTTDRTTDFLAAWRLDIGAKIERDCNDTVPASLQVAGVFDIVNPSEKTVVVGGLANGIWFEPGTCVPLAFDVEDSTATLRADQPCMRTTTEPDRMETWMFTFSAFTLELDGAGTQLTIVGAGASTSQCSGTACTSPMQTCDYKMSGTAAKL